MCGIFGFTGISLREPTVEKLISRLVCRGPDQQAGSLSARTGVMCARLALWHEGMCAQPYTSGSQSIVLNGELFNLQDLRSSLDLPGASEVQTFMIGWQREGANFFSSVDGQFASILIDHETGTLKAVRDEWGICPLYYAVSDGSIVIGSSIESVQVVRSTGVGDLDVTGLLELSAWWGFRLNQTCWRHIDQLRPGQELTFSPETGLQLTDPPRRHWSPAITVDARDRAVTAWLGSALRSAVDVRTRGTAPVATLLSGGIDSALVAHAAAAAGTRQSFGLTMPGEDDVSAQQIRIASHLGLSHEMVDIGATVLLNAFVPAVKRIGAPIARLGPVGMYVLASRLRDDGLHACLSGEGADEIFCGYDSFRLGRLTTSNDSTVSLSTLGRPEIAVDSSELYWKFASSDTWNPLRKRLGTARFLMHFLAADTRGQIAQLEEIAGGWEQRNEPVEAIRSIEIEHTLSGYLLGPQGDHVWASQAVEMRYPWLAMPVAAIGFAFRAQDLFDLTESKMLIRKLARDWFDESWLRRSSIDFTKRAYKIDANTFLADDDAIEKLSDLVDACPSQIINVGRVRRMLAACVAKGIATERESSVLTLTASLGVLLG